MNTLILDNGPEHFDRYALIIEGDHDNALFMSENPFHPQGFGQHGACSREWAQECIDAGQEIEIEDLPDKARQCARREQWLVADTSSYYYA